MSEVGVALLTETAEAINKVGIPFVLAWFMFRLEKLITANTEALIELRIIVVKLCEANGLDGVKIERN